MSPDEFREGLDVALGGARGQRPIPGGAVLGTHPEVASVSATLEVNSCQFLSILGR
jgi:hypothetical protein